jgi:Ecdysteroid kinase-like family
MVADSIARLPVDWYSTALRQAGHTEAPVAAAAPEPMAITGAAADMARVRLTYEPAGRPGPATVIAKIRGTDPVRAAMDAAMGLFEREARFYATYAEQLPITVPRCYHVGDGNQTPLLLEDLGGLRMGDQLAGAALGDVERLIDLLADLHARYWEHPPDDGGLLVSPGDGAYAAMIAQLVASGADAVAERFAGRAPERVLGALADHATRWTDVLARCAEGPPTLAHNDCRLDNVFFRSDGEPVLIDWQIIARARGTGDVAYLLAGSVDPELLHDRWETLLRRYHDRLVDRGVERYSWERCLEHYRVSVLYALSPGIAMLGSLGDTDSRGLGEAIVLRALLHAGDLESFEALAGS